MKVQQQGYKAQHYFLQIAIRVSEGNKHLAIVTLQIKALTVVLEKLGWHEPSALRERGVETQSHRCNGQSGRQALEMVSSDGTGS